jgi:hypothetical protein
MKPQWEFKEDAAGWFWIRCDGASLTESERFSSPAECIEDAEFHGYVDDTSVCRAFER